MWIQEYREREKLELWQFQQRVNEYRRHLKEPAYGTVSAELIHMLEVDKNAVTHPKIANAIAVLCEATPKQRDMIVAERHRGKWKGPTAEELRMAKIINTTLFANGIDFCRASAIVVEQNTEKKKRRMPSANIVRPVVKVDILGNVVERYSGAKQASEFEQLKRSSIKTRCQRRVKNEFARYGIEKESNSEKFTFRYADEWDTMTREEKIADIQRSLEAEKSK